MATKLETTTTKNKIKCHNHSLSHILTLIHWLWVISMPYIDNTQFYQEKVIRKILEPKRQKRHLQKVYNNIPSSQQLMEPSSKLIIYSNKSQQIKKIEKKKTSWILFYHQRLELDFISNRINNKTTNHGNQRSQYWMRNGLWQKLRKLLNTSLNWIKINAL